MPALIVNGAYVRTLRDAHGYTIRAFAKVVETSESNLGHIEAGRRQPAPDLRKRIAANLGVPLLALTQREEFEAALQRMLQAVA